MNKISKILISIALLMPISALAAPFIVYQGGTGTSTFPANWPVTGFDTSRLTATTTLNLARINANSSAGLAIYSNNGTNVALFGAGGGSNATFYGGTTVQGILNVIGAGTSTFSGNIDVTGNAKISGNIFAPINLQLSGFTQGSTLFVGTSGTIAQDNANFFWDDANNRLGIGTVNPGSNLEVSGSSGQVAIFKSSATAGAYLTFNESASVRGYVGGGAGILTGGLTSSFGVRAQGAFHVGTNGDNIRLTVDTSGNVGIGTTNPSAAKLVVQNTTGTTGTNTVVGKFNVTSTNNGGSAILQVGTADSHFTEFEQNDGGSTPFRFGTYIDTNIVNNYNAAGGAFGNINFVTGNGTQSVAMTIGGGTQKGNVGIGTTIPAAKLSISAQENLTLTNFTQSISNAGILIQTNYTGGAYTPGLFWRTDNNNPTKPKGGIWLLEDGSGTDMYFGTSNDYTIGVTNKGLVLDQSGRVGIGTTTPNVSLSVNGDIQIEKGAPAYTDYLVCYMNGGKLGHMTQAALLAGAGAASCVAN